MGEPIEKGWLRVNSDPLKHAGIHTPLPSLRGEADTFWNLVQNHPNDLPAQLANKLYSATGRNMCGAQIKALIDAGPPKNESDHEPLPW